MHALAVDLKYTAVQRGPAQGAPCQNFGRETPAVKGDFLANEAINKYMNLSTINVTRGCNNFNMSC